MSRAELLQQRSLHGLQIAKFYNQHISLNKEGVIDA